MYRHFLILFFGAAICLFSFLYRSTLHAEDRDINTQITTPEQAAEFASMLANRKCEESFGKSPFTPESYVAQFVDSKWNWGKIEPPGIHGFSADIGFNADGLEQKVRVVYHTDAARIVAPGSMKERK